MENGSFYACALFVAQAECVQIGVDVEKELLSQLVAYKQLPPWKRRIHGCKKLFASGSAFLGGKLQVGKAVLYHRISKVNVKECVIVFVCFLEVPKHLLIWFKVSVLPCWSIDFCFE